MEGGKDMYNVLYVDDEENNLTSFKAALRRNYNVYTALSGYEGMDVLAKTDIHVIVTDQRMPNMTGVQFLQHIPVEQENARIILTGFSDMESIIEGINKGSIFRYISKPWNREELKIAIDNAIEIVILRRNNRQLIHELRAYSEQLEAKVTAYTLETQAQPKEIQVQNDEIRFQTKEIKAINECLESLVKTRTQELEQKSKTVEEAALIAPKIRASVANVLGLINLITKCELNDEARKIAAHLEDSAEKLNVVVREITQAWERSDT